MEKKSPHSIVVSRGGRASTLAPLLRAPMSECDYIKCTMFSEIIHHIIISKYTLECTQLNYFLKIFLEEHTLESSINKIEQRYTHSTINNARGMYYNTTPLAKKLHPLFGHRFLPLKNDHLFRHPPPTPPVMIVYVTIMPCQRSRKRKIPTTPLVIRESIIKS